MPYKTAADICRDMNAKYPSILHYPERVECSLEKEGE